MKLKKLVALMMVSVMTLGLVACGDKDKETTTTGANGDGAAEKVYERPAKPDEKQLIELRMWGAEEDQEMLQGMIDSFIAEYGDWAEFKIELGVESESSAKDAILTDVEAAADVYAFASDQINALVNAGALQVIDSEGMDETLKTWTKDHYGSDTIKSANASGSVEAATVDGKLYAFPMSADNGYFLYYDSSVLTADDVASWDSLLAAADKAGKKVGMVLNSGWYNAGFFYGAGFTTARNDDGTTSIDWTGTADYTGVQVVQAMLNIAGNSAFMAVEDGKSSTGFSTETCAMISGTWDATAAQEAWGEGYAATKLPTFTCDGKQVQQGSVAGFKLVGVNPNSAQPGWATLLAEWITNEENQKIRFETREIGPSNLKAQESDAVKNNIAIAALAEQSAYGVVQVVGDFYWEPTKAFGQNIATGTVSADDEEAIQKLLEEVKAGVEAAIE